MKQAYDTFYLPLGQESRHDFDTLRRANSILATTSLGTFAGLISPTLPPLFSRSLV